MIILFSTFLCSFTHIFKLFSRPLKLSPGSNLSVSRDNENRGAALTERRTYLGFSYLAVESGLQRIHVLILSARFQARAFGMFGNHQTVLACVNTSVIFTHASSSFADCLQAKQQF